MKQKAQQNPTIYHSHDNSNDYNFKYKLLCFIINEGFWEYDRESWSHYSLCDIPCAQVFLFVFVACALILGFSKDRS